MTPQEMEEYRTRMGFKTHTDFSSALHVTRSTYNNWRDGTAMPSAIADTAIRILVFIHSQGLLDEWVEYAKNNIVSGDGITLEMIHAIVDHYTYSDIQYRMAAIDDVNNHVYETTNLLDLHAIAEKYSKLGEGEGDYRDEYID